MTHVANIQNVAGFLAALAALAGSQLRTSNTNRQQPAANNQTHEMTVPNELIGCIIGKGGTKIAEIRQISGAMIRISNCEEREGGATDRTITITGNPDAVALAQYLISMRWVPWHWSIDITLACLPSWKENEKKKEKYEERWTIDVHYILWFLINPISNAAFPIDAFRTMEFVVNKRNFMKNGSLS